MTNPTDLDALRESAQKAINDAIDSDYQLASDDVRYLTQTLQRTLSAMPVWLEGRLLWQLHKIGEINMRDCTCNADKSTELFCLRCEAKHSIQSIIQIASNFEDKLPGAEIYGPLPTPPAEGR